MFVFLFMVFYIFDGLSNIIIFRNSAELAATHLIVSAVSQPMVSRYIAKYTRIIVKHLIPNYVRFPQTIDERNQTKANFMMKYNIPGTLGIIDGTHVAIAALPNPVEAAFVNRKGDHSINVQIICDSNMLITNVNARYPGSTCIRVF